MILVQYSHSYYFLLLKERKVQSLLVFTFRVTQHSILEFSSSCFSMNFSIISTYYFVFLQVLMGPLVYELHTCYVLLYHGGSSSWNSSKYLSKVRFFFHARTHDYMCRSYYTGLNRKSSIYFNS